MSKKIKDYIDFIFRDAPAGAEVEEMKEEMLSNTLDKYEDFIRCGESEQSAYNMAVSSIGDVSELIDEIRGIKREGGERDAKYAGGKGHSEGYGGDHGGGFDESFDHDRSISAEEIKRYRAKVIVMKPIYIILYVLSVVPVMIFQNEVGVVVMFIVIAAATALAVYLRSSRPRGGDDECKEYAARATVIRPIYVALYILSVIGPLLFPSEKGAIMMFCIIAVATGLAVYLKSLKPAHMPRQKGKGDGTAAEDSLSPKNASLLSIINSIIWLSVVVAYICVNIFLHMWSITWVLFLIGWVLTEITETILRLREVE